MKRFTRSTRCPICGGYENAERGVGKRCYGFVSADGEWANCTREEHAGLLDLNDSSKAYVHRMVGDCNCGKRHDPKMPKKIIATYDYKNDDGTLLYQVVRYDPKGFSQRKPEGDDWSWKLDGVQRVLYNLPNLKAEALANKPVYVVEGEKDADLLNSLGLLATTNAGGAGKWRSEYSEVLRGRDVIIIPDHDEPGLDHANKVATALQGIADSVKIVTPGESKDISEWYAGGGRPKELEEMVAATAPIKPTDLLPTQLLSNASSDERLLLGTIITTPDILPYLSPQLKTWHLSDTRYQKIYKAMLAIDERGEVVDVPTLFNELQSNPALQGSDISRAELVQLTIDLPVIAEHTVKQSLTRVREAAHMRYMLKLNDEVKRRIESGEHSVKDIYEFQNTSLDKLSVVTGVNQDFVSFAEMSKQMDQLYRDLHDGKVVTVSTGFAELDNILSWGGLIPKTTSILAAHTSFGKTAFALDLAKRIAKQGFEVAIFSLEMGADSLFMRVHSNITGLESHKVRPGMSNIERDILLNSMHEIASLPIYVNDRINDIMRIRAAIRAFVRTHKNVGVIIVDYLQLANVTTLGNNAQERERISEISKILKQSAVEFNVAIVALSQFSRDSYKEEREPTISDLYGSGSIEKDADNIWMLHGDKPDAIITIRDMVFLFNKQRRGPIGRFGLRFDTSRNRFVSYSLSDAGDTDSPVRVTNLSAEQTSGDRVVVQPEEPARVVGEDGKDLF